MIISNSHFEKKTLDKREHQCGVCGYIQDRDIAAAEVMLYWAKGTLPGLGTSLVDADLSGSTSRTRKKAENAVLGSPQEEQFSKTAGSMRQLGEKKRQKSQGNFANNKLEDVETSSSSEAN